MQSSLLMWWRFLKRQIRSGELNVLCLSLILAVSAASCVLFFSTRLDATLQSQASELIAADLVLTTDSPISKSFTNETDSLKLQTAKSARFQSMLIGKDDAVLAQIHAVESSFPLRGNSKIEETAGVEKSVSASPKANEIWLDDRLMERLNAHQGDTIQLGDKTFTIKAKLIEEAGSGIDLFNLLPKASINLSDLEATGLVQEGSRIRYHLFVSGSPSSLSKVSVFFNENLPRGAKLEDVSSARPEVKTALSRAKLFLGLSTSLSVILSIAALSLACRRYLSRHTSQVAIMRALGASNAYVLRLFLWQFILLGIFGGVLGSLIGFGIQEALLLNMQSLFNLKNIAPTSWWLFLSVPVASTLLLLALILPHLFSLKSLPAVAVLRQDLPLPKKQVLSALALIFVLIASCSLQIGDFTLSWQFLLGLSGLFIILSLISIGFLYVCKKLPTLGNSFLRQGCSNLARRPLLSLLQIISLSVSLLALLTVTLVKDDLLSAWEKHIPDQAPNQFVLGIQQDQLPALNAFFEQKGMTAPTFSPMTRARLTHVNNQELDTTKYEDERARRLAEREFNLSWSDSLPTHNQLSSGRFWQPNDKTPAFSLEDGLAETLHLKIGDVLTFDIAGQDYSAPVTNLRKVNWDTFQVNFFALGNNAWLKDAPASYISSFYLPPEQKNFINDASKDFPNISFIDVGAVLGEVKNIITQLSTAINAVFVLCLVASLMVLWASLLSAKDERLFDMALMRSLGASNRYLRISLLYELLIVGAFSGFLAGALALGLNVYIGNVLLDLPPKLNILLPLIGLILGALCATISGYPILKSVLKISPSHILKQY